MKYVPCDRCSVEEVLVPDDFDEVEDFVICERCDRELAGDDE